MKNNDRPSWKTKLAHRIPLDLERDIDAYEMQLLLRKQAKIDDRLFAETRLRRGVYGQRYDDGKRHDGIRRRTIAYDRDQPTKGPGAFWDAPGMQRIKLPWGGVEPEQLEAIADLAEEYADGILHVTTRQDIQLHFVHIDDTPDLMRRLAAAGVTTQEACGNSVRNVTACPMAGVCPTEQFDVTPHAETLARFLLGHRDLQGFGRKFKISFSGCAEASCGLARMHDIGLVAKVREDDQRRGFEAWVGGGLGAIPHQAKLFSPFVPDDEILPLVLAIGRVFARLGEKKNRQKARMKFLVEKLGIDELRRLVRAELAVLPPDPRFSMRADRGSAWSESAAPPRIGSSEIDALVRIGRAPSTRFEAFRRTNVRSQKQKGFVLVTVRLLLGDITADQARRLADIARRHSGGRMRATVDQNLLLRWIREEELRLVFEALEAAHLASGGAGTIADITACPGTDTCRLGIASSRGLAVELTRGFEARPRSIREASNDLEIKVSGCFNACGQHHIADIGFYGMSKKKGAHAVPHFQVVVGGTAKNNASAYGLAIGAVPSKQVPRVVDRLADLYDRRREQDESFSAFVARLGKSEIRSAIEDLMAVGHDDDDPAPFTDWGDPREYSMEDHRSGEGAGHPVTITELGLQASEREIFAAQIHLERGDATEAAIAARRAIVEAARTLVRVEDPDVDAGEDAVGEAFAKRFVEPGRFPERFAKPLFSRDVDGADARRRIDEAQVFVDLAHTLVATKS